MRLAKDDPKTWFDDQSIDFTVVLQILPGRSGLQRVLRMVSEPLSMPLQYRKSTCQGWGLTRPIW
jgi:hypothetical protein